MPKKIEPEVRERALRLLETHGGEYPSLTAAAEAIAAGNSGCGLGVAAAGGHGEGLRRSRGDIAGAYFSSGQQ